MNATVGSGCDFLDVFVEVSNSGSTPGAEVVQLYLDYPISAGEPMRQLKAFVKTRVLNPGEQVSVTNLCVSKRSVSIYDEQLHNWRMVSGTFTLFAGSSSSDIRLTTSFDV